MVFAIIIFANLVTAFNPLLPRGIEIPADCLSDTHCPAEMSEIGAACIAYTGGDDSQKETCDRLCVPETKQRMSNCLACVWGVDSVLGGQLEAGNTKACEVNGGGAASGLNPNSQTPAEATPDSVPVDEAAPDSALAEGLIHDALADLPTLDTPPADVSALEVASTENPTENPVSDDPAVEPSNMIPTENLNAVPPTPHVNVTDPRNGTAMNSTTSLNSTAMGLSNAFSTAVVQVMMLSGLAIAVL